MHFCDLTCDMANVLERNVLEHVIKEEQNDSEHYIESN